MNSYRVHWWMDKCLTHPWQKEGSHLSSSWAKGRLSKVTCIRTSDYFAILSGWFNFGFIKPLSQSYQSTALLRAKKVKHFKIMSWREHSLATIKLHKAWENSSEHLTGNWFYFLIWYVENMEQVFLANHIETWSIKP